MDLSFDDWMSLLTAIGTIGAASVAALSVIVVRRQVRWQTAPRFVLHPSQITIRATTTSIDGIWAQQIETDIDKAGSPPRMPMLRIQNIGNAPAYRVLVSVKIDWETQYPVVERTLSQVRPDLTFKHDEFGAQLLRDGKTIGGWRLSEDAATLIESVGAAGTDSSIVSVPLDPTLQFFCLCDTATFVDLAKKGSEGSSGQADALRADGQVSWR